MVVFRTLKAEFLFRVKPFGKYSTSVTPKHLLCYQNGKDWAVLTHMGNIRRSMKIFRQMTTIIECKVLSDFEEFMTCRHIVHDDFVEHEKVQEKDSDVWLSKLFSYNINPDKNSFGPILLKSYKILSNQPSPEGLFSASILGWCLEMNQAYLHMFDDIMEERESRQGKFSWYKQPEVRMLAVNDAILLQCGVYKILKKHFSNQLFYYDVVHEFLQVSEKTTIGQYLDKIIRFPKGKPNYQKFTTEYYKTIVEYKNSHYSFVLLVHLAMHLVGGQTNEEFKITEQLCMKLSLIHQLWEEYLDCFGDFPAKASCKTNIKRGKCSWFAVTFLENAKDSFKLQFMENFGKPDDESAFKVMRLYKKLCLKEKCREFQDMLSTEVKNQITNELSDQRLQHVFQYLLENTHKRKLD